MLIRSFTLNWKRKKGIYVKIPIFASIEKSDHGSKGSFFFLEVKFPCTIRQQQLESGFSGMKG